MLFIDNRRQRMNLPDAPIAHEGFFATHFFTAKVDGWNKRTFAHGWLGLSPRKANSTLRPPGSFIAFLEDSTVTKTELICART